MKKIYLFSAFTFCFLISFSQEATEMNYETFGEFLTEQSSKIALITDGISKAEATKIMGESIIVNIPKTGKIKALSQLFKQPEFVNIYKSNPEKTVEVLWYFSTPKDQNGVISKGECTPVIFENDVVVGKGWTFFNNYRRKNRLR